MSFRQWLSEEPQRSRILREIHSAAYFAAHVDECVDFIARNPKLKDCSRESLLSAIATAGRWGVKVGRESAVLSARLVDGEMQAFAMLHYRAEMALLKARKIVKLIEARAVYKHEHFVVHQGTRKLIEHHVIHEAGARGELSGGYAWAEDYRRNLFIVTLGAAEIDQIRDEHSDECADGDLDLIARWFVPKTCIHLLRREIGLPEDFLAKYSDDFERPASNVDVTLPVAAPVAGDIDPYAGMRNEVAAA